MHLHNLFFLMFQWRKFNFFDIIHDADSKKISQTIGVRNFDNFYLYLSTKFYEKKMSYNVELQFCNALYYEIKVLFLKIYYYSYTEFCSSLEKVYLHLSHRRYYGRNVEFYYTIYD